MPAKTVHYLGRASYCLSKEQESGAASGHTQLLSLLLLGQGGGML